MSKAAITKINAQDLSAAQVALCAQAATEIRRCDTTMMKAAFIIGERLNSVKCKLSHGQFGAWLARDVGYTVRTAQNYMNASRHLGEKYETVSQLPMKTVYEIAALPPEKRAEIVSLITDPVNPPIKEIKDRVGILQYAERQAKATKLCEEIEAAKDAKRSPAARKAAKGRKEREAAEVEAQRLKQERNTADLEKGAADLAAKMGPELIDALLKLTKTHHAYCVVEALRKSKDTLGVPDNVVTIDTSTPDDELADLDLTHAA